MVGPVPVWITNRPSADVYFQANAAVEAEALISAGKQWKYNITVEFDKERGDTKPRFIEQSFTEIKNEVAEPEFSLRVAAEVEFGITLSWEISIYKSLQVGLAADLGIAGSIEVGTSLESIAVTPQYFYTLNKFELGVLLRMKGEIGLDSDVAYIGELLKNLIAPDDEEEKTCTLSLTSSYWVPTLSTEHLELPEPLSKVLDFVNDVEMEISYSEGSEEPDMEEMGIEDAQSKESSKVKPLGDREPGFASFEFQIFEAPLVTIFELPTIEIEEVAEPLICPDDTYAIKWTFRATMEQDGLIQLGIRDEEWFENFDGSIFDYHSDWRIVESTKDTITVGLPRANDSKGVYEIEEGMNVIYRATPGIMPWPVKSLMTSYEADEDTAASVPAFDCCDDSDCFYKNNGVTAASDGNPVVCQYNEYYGAKKCMLQYSY